MTDAHTFGTVLVNRKTNARPKGKTIQSQSCQIIVLSMSSDVDARHCHCSAKHLNNEDWELQLRPICRKIRVVENLLSGAHLLVTGSPSVAVRVYNTEDATRFENISTGNANTDTIDMNMEIEGLPHFRDTYEHSIVIFVLPTGQQQRDQLGRRESFVNSSQRALLLDRVQDGNEQVKKVRV
jgi:hypothetical protein